MKNLTQPQITVNFINTVPPTGLQTIQINGRIVRLAIQDEEATQDEWLVLEPPKEYREWVTPSVKPKAVSNLFLECGGELLADLINSQEPDDRINTLETLLKWARAYLKEIQDNDGLVPFELDYVAPEMMITALNLMY